MTTTDERPSNYHPIDPELGRSARAKERAAAEEDSTGSGALRAQPRAGARARQSVAAAGATVREKAEQRRAAVRTRGRGEVATGAARPSPWESRPPALAELYRRAQAGPVRAVRMPDGAVTEESVDWPEWQVIAWKVYAYAELAVAAPAYGVLHCLEKPGRAGWLVLLVGLAVFIAVYATTYGPAVTPGGEG